MSVLQCWNCNYCVSSHDAICSKCGKPQSYAGDYTGRLEAERDHLREQLKDIPEQCARLNHENNCLKLEVERLRGALEKIVDSPELGEWACIAKSALANEEKADL